LTFDAEVDAVVAELVTSQVLSEQSLRRVTPLLERFRWFATAADSARLVDVTPALAERFVRARTSTQRAAPSAATMHARRSAVRLLFRVGRQLGFCDWDPTADLELPPRSGSQARPLTDEEVSLCRSASLSSLEATRLPAAWALAEATVRSGELHAVHVEDVCLERGRVLIRATSRTEKRWGELSDWGCRQLRRRLDAIGERSCVIYAGDGGAESRQSSSCQAIHEALMRAGLSSEPDVRPVSVAAWAGRAVFDRTQRIDDVAKALGVRSLDQAARIIGWDWTAVDP
jgi:integrase/recombinase XerC